MKFSLKTYIPLIKPSLTYLGVVLLASSAALYYAEGTLETQNISNEITNKPEVFVTKNPLPSDNSIQTAGHNKFNLLKTSNLHKEYWCLKVLGWNEIRNGSEYAMKAVYSVVENRKNSKIYPDTYCGIMKQNWQFSFWNKGKYNLAAVEPKPKNAKDALALKKIEQISFKVVSGTFNPVLPSNVLWYSTPAARQGKGSNHWTWQYRVATQAGPHLFYTKPQSI